MTKESTTRNKGEWAEVWAILKILSAGRIPTLRVQAEGVRSTGGSVMIERLRTGRSGRIVDYVCDRDEVGQLTGVRLVDNELGVELADFPIDEVRRDFHYFDQELQRKTNDSSGTFPLVMGDALLPKYHLGSGKSPSKLKRDCELVLIAPDGVCEECRGFSIKSFIGSNPTLFNASGSAIFSYRVNGEVVEKVESTLKRLKNSGSRWAVKLLDELNSIRAFDTEVFAGSKVFAKNLSLLDSNMAVVVGHLLRFGRTAEVGGTDVKAALEKLIVADPLGVGASFSRSYYSFRVKHFLRAAALGLTAGTPWDGKEDAEGGMLIVTQDWNLFCILANKHEFDRYLIETCFLDTPSTSRYPEYATLVRDDDGVVWFRLHLQIREHSPKILA